MIHSACAEKEGERSRLASKMAAFEREHGPVETTPILIRAGIQQANIFRQYAAPAERPTPKPAQQGIAKPARKKVSKPSLPIGGAGGQALAARAKLARDGHAITVKALAAAGWSLTQIGKQLGIDRKTAGRVAKENGIEVQGRASTPQAKKNATLREEWE